MSLSANVQTQTQREPRHRSVRHRVCFEATGLRAIQRRGVDLCLWRRALDPELSSWLAALPTRHRFDVDEQVSFDDVPVTRWLQPVGDGPQARALAADVRALGALFAKTLGCTRGRAKLHTVTTQHCPRFHVDSVTVRLITTYAGPGTEWLSETALDRCLLGTGKPTSLPVVAGGTANAMERFDVALMKGRSFRNNGAFGVVHRSPAVTTQPRLVLSFDEVT